MGKQYQVLARKYRPQKFIDVVGQQSILTTLKNALKFDQVAHAYLFSGSRGVGKTTLARLFAKALNCLERGPDLEPCNACSSCLDIGSGQSLDVIEIDGASNRGIDDIRQINETVGYAPTHGKYKIYIIDEVHMLTKEAFNALLKTLEEPPEKAKFFFATTEPHKVLPTIISRCQRFDLSRINQMQISQKLTQIISDMGRDAEEEALQIIASFAEGSLRDAESLLDQILCFTSSTIQASTVRDALGLVSEQHFIALDQAFAECRLAYAFELVDLLFQTGKDLTHFLEQLVDYYRSICLCKTFPEHSLPDQRIKRHASAAALYTQPQALYILDLLIQAEQTMQKSPFPRVTLEATLLHLIRSKHRVPVEIITRRLHALEETLITACPIAKDSALISESEDRAPSSIQKLENPTITTPPSALTAEPLPEILSAPASVFAQPIQKVEQTEVIEAPPPPTPSIFAPPPITEESSQPSVKPSAPSVFDPLLNQPKHASHYETMIRFAAVELEGTLKT